MDSAPPKPSMKDLSFLDDSDGSSASQLTAIHINKESSTPSSTLLCLPPIQPGTPPAWRPSSATPRHMDFSSITQPDLLPFIQRSQSSPNVLASHQDATLLPQEPPSQLPDTAAQLQNQEAGTNNSDSEGGTNNSDSGPGPLPGPFNNNNPNAGDFLRLQFGAINMLQNMAARQASQPPQRPQTTSPTLTVVDARQDEVEEQERGGGIGSLFGCCSIM